MSYYDGYFIQYEGIEAAVRDGEGCQRGFDCKRGCRSFGVESVAKFFV